MYANNNKQSVCKFSHFLRRLLGASNPIVVENHSRCCIGIPYKTEADGIFHIKNHIYKMKTIRNACTIYSD